MQNIRIFTINSNAVVYNLHLSILMHEEIKYQTNWARLYILLGILFGLMFIFGGLLLKDYTVFFNLIAAFIVIYIGWGMLKRPYAIYNNTELIVYGLTSAVRKHYQFKTAQEVEIHKNRLYLNGKKLKINGWIVAKADWQRMLRFFGDDAPFNELQDD